ncbi:unnamed protein product [Merluccius merluccius]
MEMIVTQLEELSKRKEEILTLNCACHRWGDRLPLTCTARPLTAPPASSDATPCGTWTPSEDMAPLVLVLLLLASQAGSPARAQRSLGCLFQNELCSPYEICVNDGMFGRCHSLPVKESSTYDVSPAVVQRFRILLEKLSNRGLTWEDDATQQVLAQELSKLRRIPSGPPDNRPVYPTSSRSAAAVDPASRRVKEELNLQTYLQRLALLPHTNGPHTPSKVRACLSGPPDSRGVWMSVPADYHRPRTQGAPGGQRSPSVQTSMPLGPQGEGELLVAALRHYLSGQLSLGPPGPLYTNTGEESSKARLLKVAGAPRWAARGPLSSVDVLLSPQRFIQKVLRNVGRQHLLVEELSPDDLDQNPPGPGRTRDRPEPRDLEQEEGGEEKKEGEGGEEEEEEEEEGEERRGGEEGGEDEEAKVEDSQKGDLFSKLLAYLDKSTFDPAGAPDPRGAGLESVRSRTKQGAVQKKDASQSLEEVSEKSVGHAPELQLDVSGRKADDDVFGYVITDTDGLQTDEGLHLMEVLAHMANIQMTDVAELSYVYSVCVGLCLTSDLFTPPVHQWAALEKEAKLTILEAGVAEGSQINQIPTKYSQAESTKFLVLTVVSLLCIVAVLLASTVVYCLRHRSHHKLKEKLSSLGTDTPGDTTSTYQELCRQRMAVKPPPERPEPLSSRINSVSSQFSDGGAGGGGAAVSPSTRSSTSSWCEEPSHSNMDISTGHMILAYMEDHLKNKDRLEKEWEALCSYQAEPNATAAGLRDGNAKKNRSSAVVAYDHSRISLKVENSQGHSDYINASPIMDHDPRSPAYIATQGPLPSTVADFWQMVWENGCVVIVMLTPLVEGGVKQCYHYWPDEGSNLYHIYEVNLVSEHIWCDDFLVRSFYLKNMQTNETRTVTQFHFLTWLSHAAPESSRSLLDFRRKVNRCYRGRSCPIIVHCSDGAGRTGTYTLIDMVLNKMAKGAKEIDIAATLEHLRDQRPGMVGSKEQFEFVLTAVAEEVNVILKALPQ